jgi:precorrin-2 dehydrogenase/sirohydrochlorin ferrochelatase
VIAATDDQHLNRRISEHARKRRLLVNAVDQPADCDFIFPSIVKRGDLLIAISTAGKSPALAKRLREELETQFGREYGVFVDLMGRLRTEILSRGFSQKQNSVIFHKIVNSEILKCLSQDDWKGVRSILERILPEDVAVGGTLEELAHG